MKTPVLLALLAAVLLGCSTTAKTSVSLGYAISPQTIQEGTVTRWAGGAALALRVRPRRRIPGTVRASQLRLVAEARAERLADTGSGRSRRRRMLALQPGRRLSDGDDWSDGDQRGPRPLAPPLPRISHQSPDPPAPKPPAARDRAGIAPAAAHLVRPDPAPVGDVAPNAPVLFHPSPTEKDSL